MINSYNIVESISTNYHAKIPATHLSSITFELNYHNYQKNWLLHWNFLKFIQFLFYATFICNFRLQTSSNDET